MKMLSSALFAAALLLSIGVLAPAVAPAQEGMPVTIPFTKQYDLKSQINGQSYRLWISTPEKMNPAIAYPVFYALDGNELEGTLAYVSRKLSSANDVTRTTAEIKPAIVVGIGYPTDDLNVWRTRRNFDLTTSTKQPGFEKLQHGGMDAFIRVILEEIRPFVAAHFKTDPALQIVQGHSLGGLTVLRILFRNPTAFNVYCISSPSIWWNQREVLADEPAFAKRAHAGEFNLRIAVNSAGDEQYRGDDPNLLAIANHDRMIDNSSELADRLAALNPEHITVTRTIFPGESHASAVSPSLVRSLRFALSLK